MYRIFRMNQKIPDQFHRRRRDAQECEQACGVFRALSQPSSYDHSG